MLGGNYQVFAGTASDVVADKNFGNNNLSYLIIISNDSNTDSAYLHLSMTQTASGILKAMVTDPTTNSLLEVKAGEVLTIEGNFRQISIICADTKTVAYRIWVFQMGVSYP